jgi:capsule polysaccharide modification protein KpsS
VTRALQEGEISDVAIFNPYMKSHAAFKSIVALARELDREVIVLERGALPSTIYYDSDVCYNSSAYSQQAFDEAYFSEDELLKAQDYVEGLVSGASTLEKMDTYQTTAEKHLALSSLKARKIFIPLQLEDDMAVTMFIRGEQTYPEFLEALPSILRNHPDIIFVVKPHPLSKFDKVPNAPNVIIAAREDNVHALLDIADATLCYNSGLLSLLHRTATITLGNAFYNISGAGYRASSASEGIDAFLGGKVTPPPQETVLRLAAWFTQRKYSTFIATDDIREFEHRKSHGYKNILVTEFKWKGHSHTLARLKQTAPFSWESYGASKLAPIKEAPPKPKRDVETHVRWAKADFYQANYGKAAKLFLEAYELSPKRGKYLRLAAEAYWRAGDREAAIATQRRAVAANPRCRGPRSAS